MVSRRMMCAALFALALLFLAAPLVQAEGGATELRLPVIDASRFPLIRFRAAPLQAGSLGISGLTADAFRVYEDGTARPVESVTPVSVGTQIAIVLDASKNVERRRDDIVKGIDELVLKERDPWIDTANRQEQMTLLVPKGDNDFEVAVAAGPKTPNGWTTDGMLIHNSAYTYNYKAASNFTALHAMLLGALTHMKDVPDYEQRPKFVIVFSDGVDVMSAADVTDVINRAQALQATILTVRLGAPDPQRTKNLQRMAEMTDGAMAAYPGANLEVLEPLYAKIRSQKAQYEVAYRSAIARSGKHGLQAGVVIEGSEIKSRLAELSITVLPPAVQIIEPSGEVVYERKTDQPGADPKALEPHEQAIKFRVTFPDNHPRTITKMTFFVDGIPLAVPSPDQPFTWDFSTLPAGDHSIKVEVTDDLGLVGGSEAVKATININIPPLPTATVPNVRATIVVEATRITEKIKKETGDEVRRVSAYTIAALVLAAMAVLVAIYVLIRKPQVVRDATQALASAVREATQPYRGRDRVRRLRAQLVVLNDDGSRGQTRPIYSQVVTLGRDPTKSKMVFADNLTISRLHARIVEETTGVFRIHDEGGPNGTYVNDASVPMQGTVLHPGDMIGMGDLVAVFELPGEAAPPRPQPLPTPIAEPGDSDKTQPFVSRLQPGPAPVPPERPGDGEQDLTQPFVGRGKKRP